MLVDQSAIDAALLIEAAKGVDGVRDVSRVRSRWIGSDRAIDMIVTVNPRLSTSDSHVIADQIESVLEERGI